MRVSECSEQLDVISTQQYVFTSSATSSPIPVIEFQNTATGTALKDRLHPHHHLYALARCLVARYNILRGLLAITINSKPLAMVHTHSRFHYTIRTLYNRTQSLKDRERTLFSMQLSWSSTRCQELPTIARKRMKPRVRLR